MPCSSSGKGFAQDGLGDGDQGAAADALDDAVDDHLGEGLGGAAQDGADGEDSPKDSR